ncbi:DMT family transporter [Kitasatospora sp. NPDC050543]|uniref:DMT family transporter n=1 Tax=Kitasatospora sp. NPDC050543 TaxID=3364054 RepID=UPI003787FC89
MVSVLFAVLTALSNGTASVFQRRAASTMADSASMRVSLVAGLLRRKVWLAGICLVVVAGICQAVALSTGPISLVQPIFVIELPATLLLAGVLLRRRLPATTWAGVACVTVGLALGLGAAAPSAGSRTVRPEDWPFALIAIGALEALLIGLALRRRGNPRAALFGLAAACGYALTAALMKDAMARLADGVVQLLTAWQLYGTALAGVASLFLLQNAFQAGALVASQPMLTLGDAILSTCLGVALFAETIRTGWWILPEVVGLTLIAIGCVVLARASAESGLATAAGPATTPAAGTPATGHPVPGTPAPGSPASAASRPEDEDGGRPGPPGAPS